MSWLKIKNTFNFYKLCFLNWKAGNGFRVPEPGLRMKCFFEYCEKITKGTLKNHIEAYEEELQRLMNKSGLSRAATAKTYLEVYKEIFEEGKPW